MELSRGELAKKYFLDGYNCSQAVVLAFEDKIGIDKESLLKIASSFGGGMGRLRETCGAVSGMLVVVGLLYGYDTPETGTVKAELYKKVQDVARRFEDINGSIVCRELLGIKEKHQEPTPEARNAGFYEKRPCPDFVKQAAKILEQYIG